MADGFLSPEGKFFEKTEAYHAEAARRILGKDYKGTDPVSELIRQGYLALIEFRAPHGTVSLQPDLDYVLGKRNGQLSEPQKQWLQEHLNELTVHQQYTINMDQDGIFKDLEISNVRLYDACRGCPIRPGRLAWCEGKLPEEPYDCRVCDKISDNL